MTRCRVKPLITRVHLDMHHIPAFELNVIHVPFFSPGIAFKDKAALLRSNENHDLFAHCQLLLNGNRKNVLRLFYHALEALMQCGEQTIFYEISTSVKYCIEVVIF